MLGSGLKNQLFMYICQVFPNTDLAAPEYLAKFGVQTRVIELTEIHGQVRTGEWVKEQEEIVIGTAAMPTADWRRALTFSWVTMVMHSLKLGFHVVAWLVDRFGIRHSDFLEFVARGEFAANEFPRITSELATFGEKIDRLVAGEGRGCVMPAYGGIYWDEEEASFLRLSADFDGFYEELRGLVVEFLEQRGVAFAADELDDVIRYQSLAIPRPDGRVRTVAHFGHAVHDYFEALFSTTPMPLERGRCTVEAMQPDFGGELPRFARETILWGRKSGTMLARLRAIAAVETEVPARS